MTEQPNAIRSEWLPDVFEFLRDENARVHRLRCLKGDLVSDLELGAVIVRAQVDEANPRKVEWDSYSNDHRYVDEAKIATAIIQFSIAELKQFQKKLAKQVKKGKTRNALRRKLVDEELSILGFVVAAFLLVDPMSHPDLSTLYHKKIIKLVKPMPDLKGRLNLPESAGWT